MERTSALALLCVFMLGASALVADARTHGSFSARSYYDSNETETTTITKPSEGQTATTFETDPTNRYANGYPNQKHHYNPTTEKYDEEDIPVQKKSSEVTATNTTGDPNNRYPDGYPTATHKWNKGTNRYEDDTTNTTITSKPANPSEGRYVHGYYGKATYDYKPGDTLNVIHSDPTTKKATTTTTPADGTQNRYPLGYQNGHSYAPHQTATQTSTPVDETVYDPVEGRYKYGYHPTSTYAGSQKKPASTTGVSSYAASTTTDVTPEGRYPGGYYPDSEYTKQAKSTVKPVSYSSGSSGSFSTLPYSTSGTPYVPSGAGCRTAYWADHPSSWPAFLPISSTLGDAFGSKATDVYGSETVLKALLNYAADPFTCLARTACAALLNSYGRGFYTSSPVEVVEAFKTALATKETASAQALKFEEANVESISKGNACT